MSTIDFSPGHQARIKGDCARYTPVASAYRRSDLILRAGKRFLSALNSHIARGIPRDKFSWTIHL